MTTIYGFLHFYTNKSVVINSSFCLLYLSIEQWVSQGYSLNYKYKQNAMIWKHWNVINLKNSTKPT